LDVAKEKSGVEPELTKEDVERLAEDARNAQRTWDFLVPERNMGITHPAIPFMIILTCILQFLIYQKDQQKNGGGEKTADELKAERLAQRQQRMDARRKEGKLDDEEDEKRLE